MKLNGISHVSSEGGPLILMDASYARFWRGVDGADYDRACHFFDSHQNLEGGPISVGSGNGLLWEMRGAGTAYIVGCESKGLVIVRTWPADPARTDIPELMAKEAANASIELGNIDLASGCLLVLWEAENGECVRPVHLTTEGRPSGDLAVDMSGAIVRLEPAKYVCWHDEIKNELGTARRCHLFRKE